MKKCENCRFGKVCGKDVFCENPDSEFYADYTDWAFVCEDWEGDEDGH